MNDLEKEAEEFAEGLEDNFELQDPIYEVWIIGYDADQNITDYEKLVDSDTNIDKAIKKAEAIYDDPREVVKDLPAGVSVIGIEVETVVDIDGVATNTNSVYQRRIEIVKK